MTEIHWKEQQRRTKIIATLGPATDNEEIIGQMVDAGIDAVRFNFSHGLSEDHLRRARIIRKVSEDKRYHIAIIGDLQGPKIRIQKFKDGTVHLEAGQEFTISTKLGESEGDSNGVGITYLDLYKDIVEGDELLLDDGRITLKVNSSQQDKVVTTVINGGILSNNKGLNKRGGGLSAPSITEKDKSDIRLAAEIGVDYLAVSFVRSAEDLIYARKLLKEAGGDAHLIAKIERVEALEAIDEIIEASDGVMIARGDLSIEIGDAALTGVQKKLIRKARESYRIAITATEMLQSMIDSAVPTRAEISDVANAVLDGSDALMLSAESAIGSYPVEAVKTMSRLCQGAECTGADFYAPDYLESRQVLRCDKAIALAATYTASHFKVNAIAALTESGSTSLYMSRFRSLIPIYALTPHSKTCCKVTLYRGVYPVLLKDKDRSSGVVDQVIKSLQKSRAVKSGDCVVITKGDAVGILGGTNGMKIIQVP